jgi:hypothetical protein
MLVILLHLDICVSPPGILMSQTPIFSSMPIFFLFAPDKLSLNAFLKAHVQIFSPCLPSSWRGIKSGCVGLNILGGHIGGIGQMRFGGFGEIAQWECLPARKRRTWIYVQL